MTDLENLEVLALFMFSLAWKSKHEVFSLIWGSSYETFSFYDRLGKLKIKIQAGGNPEGPKVFLTLLLRGIC